MLTDYLSEILKERDNFVDLGVNGKLLTRVWCEDAVWIHLVQDWLLIVRYYELNNEPLVSTQDGGYRNHLCDINFSRRTLLHDVS
jgi:hypothetical protein